MGKLLLALDLYQRARAYLTGRTVAYNHVFDRKSQFTPIVLADLARFCRAHVSTAGRDAHEAARLDGRREVWLRIQQHLNLSPETLWLLFDGSPPPNSNQRNDE